MTNNNAQVVFSIRDDATRTIRQVEQNVIASTRHMSQEEAIYAIAIAQTQTRIFALRQEMATASAQRQRDIRAEIAALNGLQQANRAAYSAARTTARANARANAGTGSNRSGQLMDALDQSPLGGMIDMMSNPYAAAGAAAVAAGTAIYNITEKVLASQDVWRQRVQGTELDYERLGESTLKISNVFGKNNEEIAKAGNSFSKAFGIDAKEGLDIIYEGFKKGADMNGLFLDNLNEYSIQAKAAGMTTEEFVGFLIAAEKEGIYSDKGIDGIKESGLRLRENTKAVKDALKPLKDEVELKVKSLAASGKSYEAVQLLSQELQKGYLTAEQYQTIIADVLGGPGEDAGEGLVKIFANANIELSSMASNLSENQQATIALKEEWSAFETGVGDTFSQAIIDMKVLIVGLAKFIKDNNIFGKTGGSGLFGQWGIQSSMQNKADKIAQQYIDENNKRLAEEKKQAEKYAFKNGRGNKNTNTSTPKEGDVSADGTMIFKGGKWVNITKNPTKASDSFLTGTLSQLKFLETTFLPTLTKEADKTTYGESTTEISTLIAEYKKLKPTDEVNLEYYKKLINAKVGSLDDITKTKTITDRTTNLSESKVVRSLTINIENALNIEQLNGKINPLELGQRVAESIGREVGKANDFAGKA